MKKTHSKVIMGALAVFLLIMAMFVYLYVPADAAQPGDAQDPVVTRSFVQREIAQLETEIAHLRAVIAGISPSALPPQAPPQQTPSGGGFTQADRDALFADVMLYFEAVYGTQMNALTSALENLADINLPGPGETNFEMPDFEVPVFTSMTMQAGQSIIFEAGAEFIMRGGHATIIAPDANIGIPDVTVGRDIMHGARASDNHLMIVPRSDGRGVYFHERSWIMVRGGHTIVD